jgi:hypothetical protein
LTRPISTFLGICCDAQLASTQVARPKSIPFALRAQGAAMPSLDQFAERIIDLVHTRDPGSASIAVMTADAYLVAFEASQIDTERARLIAVLEDKGPWTEAMVRVIHAIKRRSSTPGWWHHSTPNR